MMMQSTRLNDSANLSCAIHVTRTGSFGFVTMKLCATLLSPAPCFDRPGIDDL